MYDLYKPFRNELRKQALRPSLRAIWAWMQHLQFERGFPPDMQVPLQIQALRGPQRSIYEWELAVLARELIALAPDNALTDLRSWRQFRTAVNKLKALDEAISERYEKLFRENIFIEMSRHAHHQFGWQRTDRMIVEVTRYLKIFAYPGLDAILRERIGLSAHVLYTIGLSITGHFSNQSELSQLNTNLFGISLAQITLFLDLYARDIGEMRRLCIQAQAFNENFIYAFNPLVQFPIISDVAGSGTRYIAPVPTYLIRRFTEGVYYDVWDAPGFDIAFGTSYQSYVGDVLKAVNRQNALTVLPESEYKVGKDRKHSVDWIASDDTAELFIECKTKRLRQDAKFALADLAPLQAQLAKLADFAVQIYKTLADAIEGRYTHWKPTSRPIYPIVVTLEEWYIFGHRLDSEIDARLRSAFRSNALDENLLVQYPLIICSVNDFERLMALIAIKGAKSVMDATVDPKRKLWLVHAAMLDAFPEDFAKTRVNLFPEALESITGEPP
jgi:hypothetical protein